MTEITTQGMLMYLALLAMLVGMVLATMAARTYVRLRIRAVRDDLSGRTRQRLIAEQRVQAAALAASRGSDSVVARESHGIEDELATRMSAMSVQADALREAPFPFVLTRDVCCVHSNVVVGVGETR